MGTVVSRTWSFVEGIGGAEGGCRERDAVNLTADDQVLFDVTLELADDHAFGGP